MLKVKNISLSPAKYSEAYECTVTFQVGDMSYNTVPVKLTLEATREVAELAIKRATEMLTVVSTDIRCDGEPLPDVVEAPPMEVDSPMEMPAPPEPVEVMDRECI